MPIIEKNISVKITDKCNLSCPYCFALGDLSEKVHMSLDNYSWLIQFCIENRVQNIRITGGEPFLHPYIHHFIEKALKHQLDVVLYSNFTVPNCIQKIKPPVNPQKISLLININDKNFYTINQLKQIHRNIVYAKKRGYLLHLSFNVYALPIYPSHALEIASQYSIKGIRISQASPNFHDSNKSLSMIKLPQYLTYLATFAKQMEKVGVRVNADCPVPLCFIEEQEKDYLMKNVMIRGYCGERLGVYQDLTVAHCYVTRKMIKLKNLKEFATYIDALNFVSRKLDVINEKQKKLDRCRTCKYFKDKECSGGCYGLYEYKN